MSVKLHWFLPTSGDGRTIVERFHANRSQGPTAQRDPDIDYLEYAEASWGWGPTYIGELGVTAAELAEKHERLWPLSAVVMSAIGAGLAVERLGEHREGYWERFPNLPPDQLSRIPQTFSLLARRPEA